MLYFISNCIQLTALRQELSGSDLPGVVKILMLQVLLLFGQSTVASCTEAVMVHEVTMAAPDILRVEVREGAVKLGNIVALPGPSAIAYGGEIILPDGKAGIVIGPKRDHARTYDTADIARLDRAAADVAANYPPLSGLRVEGVYRKSVPWSSGKMRYGQSLMSFQHFIYLKLSGPLLEGRHTLRWPGGILPPTPFTFDDARTRASAIRASQLGHAPGDKSKIAYLALWLPDGPENGAVDFRRYGLSQFEIVDSHGTAVFSSAISLRYGPTEPEEFDGIGGRGDLITYTKRDSSTYTANRTGTYVFGLDFSAFVPVVEGRYRIRIPGLGVSDVVPMARNVWNKAAKAALGGLYNQRSGMALDGRFGYTRPECFTEASGIRVLQSKMPLVFSTEGGGGLSITAASEAPWITTAVLGDAWGGYQDAGDWDRRIDHVGSSYLLLDVYEQLPASYRDSRFGTPESGKVLPFSQYRNVELPDIVDEAVWSIDFFRRLQRTDGAVAGGIESRSTPRNWEPCWLESQTVYAYTPDPGATYRYAAAAAKLAIVLEGLGKQPLADLYRGSAVAAWTWAEDQMTDANLGMGEAFTIAGLAGAERQARLAVLTARFADYRLWAAGTLYRLTGQAMFDTAVRQRFASGWVDIGYIRADGAWEYVNADFPAADLALQQTIKNRIVDTARRYIVTPDPDAIAYRSMKHLGAPMAWGEGGAPNQNEISLLIRAHKLTAGDEFVKSMLDGSAHILGANQLGKSFTVGLGKRWPVAPLHEDSIAAGVAPPPGITIYGWAQQSLTDYSWVWTAPWAVLPDSDANRRVDPHRFSMPIYEYLIEHPLVIMSAEYTVQQTIATTAALWLYLAGQADAPL